MKRLPQGVLLDNTELAAVSVLIDAAIGDNDANGVCAVFLFDRFAGAEHISTPPADPSITIGP